MPSDIATADNPPTLQRTAQVASTADVLTDIYREDTNIVVWQRQLSPTLLNTVGKFLGSGQKLRSSITLSPESAAEALEDSLPNDLKNTELSDNIAELVDMFCCLFDLDRAGLRLTSLDQAMCPRFHVDKVPCRLVTTYHGVAT